ncbi:hypothetical protein KIN20_036100 [Parelaphostrongylus tenuis]|uniref:Uncharacterized protein n=1 Tax=Parelaphostrongylus tenuis TaxID=148309 RepID=A0AAD5RCH1_PARTN|nr:hypothetical protein KIN20_036100 [Parelaphostrongylus tenuis]
MNLMSLEKITPSTREQNSIRRDCRDTVVIELGEEVSYKCLDSLWPSGCDARRGARVAEFHPLTFSDSQQQRLMVRHSQAFSRLQGGSLNHYSTPFKKKTKNELNDRSTGLRIVKVNTLKMDKIKCTKVCKCLNTQSSFSFSSCLFYIHGTHHLANKSFRTSLVIIFDVYLRVSYM